MDSGLLQRLTRRVAEIGSDPSDSEEVALQKRLAVSLSLAIVPLALAWSAIYLAMDAPLAASIPGSYALLAPANTAIFALSRNIRLYRFGQLTMFLVLPWLLMMSLGGFRNSSAVIIWAAPGAARRAPVRRSSSNAGLASRLHRAFDRQRSDRAIPACP